MKKLCLLLSLITISCSDFLDSEDNSAFRKTEIETKITEVKYDSIFFEQINEGEYSLQKTLGNISYHIIRPNVEQFYINTLRLNRRIKKYCANIGKDRIHKKIQILWSQSMADFHRISAVPFGPMADNKALLKNQIYSYPLVSQCGLDKMILKQKKGLALPKELPINRRGLMALEYLIFEPTLISSCNSAQSGIQLWNEQSEAQKKKDRCELALTISDTLSEQVRQLNGTWQTPLFHSNFIDGSDAVLLVKSLTRIIQGMTNIEVIKDQNVAKPLGLHNDCTNLICPNEIEHQWSGMSFRSLQLSLESVKQIMTGSTSLTNGFGLIDYLESIEHKNLGERFITSIDKALASIRSAETVGPMTEQIKSFNPVACKTEGSNIQPLCELAKNFSNVATIFKIEMLTVLSLQIALPSPGDND